MVMKRPRMNWKIKGRWRWGSLSVYVNTYKQLQYVHTPWFFCTIDVLWSKSIVNYVMQSLESKVIKSTFP